MQHSFRNAIIASGALVAILLLSTMTYKGLVYSIEHPTIGFAMEMSYFA